MENDSRRNWAMHWLMVLVLAVPIVLGSCVITDSDEIYTSVVMCFNENGFTMVIRLEQPVLLPIDEEDAHYIMQSSDCPCQGRLSLVDGYWQYPEYPEDGDCVIRIDAYNGDVQCL